MRLKMQIYNHYLCDLLANDSYSKNSCQLVMLQFQLSTSSIVRDVIMYMSVWS